MLDVQKALNAAGIPGFRVSLRMGEMQEIPPVFVAWALQNSPSMFMDDAPTAMLHEVQMHLVSINDPMAPWAALQRCMVDEGFSFVEMQESYDEEADVYVLVSRWKGVELYEI